MMISQDSRITHLAFNVLTQIILGIPLELVHKFWRIALVYLSGVLAGKYC